MTPKTESHKQQIHNSPRGTRGGNMGSQNQPMGALAKMKRETFELISGYVDGEATPEERRLVNDLLDKDPESKRLYIELLQLRQKLQSIPGPESPEAVAQTVQRFFWLLDKRRQRALAWGGTAIAALFVASISGVMPSHLSNLQLSDNKPKSAESEQLTIALNRPIVVIPKAAVAVPLAHTPKSQNPNIPTSADFSDY